MNLRSCVIINILLNYLKEIKNAPCTLRYLTGKILVSWIEKFLSSCQSSDTQLLFLIPFVHSISFAVYDLRIFFVPI